MPELIKVILLGIVEGLTEFLPISSTGHLIVASALLNFQGAVGGTFEIFIQVGAVVAVIIYFRSKLLDQITTVASDQGVRRFWLNLIIAFIPAAAVGLLLGDQIKEWLFNPTVVALSLIAGGVIFLVVERHKTIKQATGSLAEITPQQALMIGLAQIIALIPGVSRSGATIVGGMLVGLNRSIATEFSFFLAIPTLSIATLYDLYKNLNRVQGSDFINLLVGAVVSAIVAWLSIGWLLSYIGRNNFVLFGYYRIIAGVIILIMIATQFI
jgi:undecaprenyl-diphosphatase